MSIIIRANADTDLLDIADYLDAHNSATAERFQEQVQLTFEQLERQPHLGRVHTPPNDRLPGLRVWPVLGFLRYAVFYLPTNAGIEIIRVLHSARDSTAILAVEE